MDFLTLRWISLIKVDPRFWVGLVECPQIDPAFWTILQTFRDARALAPRTQARQTLVKFGQDQYAGPANSIGSTFALRIRKLGWKILPSGTVSDQFGPLDILAIGHAELVFRAETAWTSVVADMMCHRERLDGLAWVDVALARKWLRVLSIAAQGAFRKILNATHITEDCLVHCDSGATDICPWCDCSDSRFHRFWVCEQFESRRANMDPAVVKLIPTLPETLTCYGWALRPVTRRDWLSCLAAIPWPQFCFPDGLRSLPAAHVFTDGSCVLPNKAAVRFASWAFAVPFCIFSALSPYFTCLFRLPPPNMP